MMKVPLDEVPRSGPLAQELLLAARMNAFAHMDRTRGKRAALAKAAIRATETEIMTIRRHSAIGTSALQIRRALMPHLSIVEIEKHVVAP